MLVIDAHLDLSHNALNWNRDLRLSVADIRQQEEGATEKGRGTNTVAFPELRAGEVGFALRPCLPEQIRKAQAISTTGPRKSPTWRKDSSRITKLCGRRVCAAWYAIPRNCPMVLSNGAPAVRIPHSVLSSAWRARIRFCLRVNCQTGGRTGFESWGWRTPPQAPMRTGNGVFR